MIGMINMATHIYDRILIQSLNRRKRMNVGLMNQFLCDNPADPTSVGTRPFYFYRGRILAEGEVTEHDDIRAGKNMNQMAIILSPEEYRDDATVEVCYPCMEIGQQIGILMFETRDEFQRITRYDTYYNSPDPEENINI